MRHEPSKQRPKASLKDYEMLKVLGKGCVGKVLLVRHKPTKRLLAMKCIHKHHVLAHRELQHTLTEQSVLKAVASARAGDGSANPFVVQMFCSFHDRDNLYLVLDFHPGGDLATQLARWGRLGRDRTRFYAAELTEGIVGLHSAGVIYRDLKPENVLIGADGHIVLTDFGLSKQFPCVKNYQDYDERLPAWMRRVKDHDSPPPSLIGLPGFDDERTATNCGTAEYLAPEIILNQYYTYSVDWWSFGTMLYEMLVGMTPFWAEDTPSMYRRVLHDELRFEQEYNLDPDTKSFIRGLLQKDPSLRMTDNRVKKHKYFEMVDFGYVYHKRYIPPYVPVLDPTKEADTSYFDSTYLEMAPELDRMSVHFGDPGRQDYKPQDPYDEHGRDVFDGYSYRGNDNDSIIDSISGDAPTTTDSNDTTGTGNGGVKNATNIVDDNDAVDEPELEYDTANSNSNNTPQPKIPCSPKTPSDTDAVPLTTEIRSSESIPSIIDAAMTNNTYKSSLQLESTNSSIVNAEIDPVISLEKELEKAAAATQELDTKATSVKSTSGNNKSKNSNTLNNVNSDNEDDDENGWDLVEKPVGRAAAGERNGRKSNTLWARGVRDMYKLQLLPATRPKGSSSTSTSQVTQSLGRASGKRNRFFAATVNGNNHTTNSNSPDLSQNSSQFSVDAAAKSSDTSLASNVDVHPTSPNFFQRNSLLKSASDYGSRSFGFHSRSKRSLKASADAVDTEPSRTTTVHSNGTNTPNVDETGVVKEKSSKFVGSMNRRSLKPGERRAPGARLSTSVSAVDLSRSHNNINNPDGNNSNSGNSNNDIPEEMLSESERPRIIRRLKTKRTNKMKGISTLQNSLSLFNPR